MSRWKPCWKGEWDALLIETIFDTLNAKAAIRAAELSMEKTGRKVPLMLSVTVSDIAGRTLSGQTLDAFLASVEHADLFSAGLNCSFGARQLKPFLEQLASRAPYYISAYPNAGLPNSLGQYDQTPEDMAAEVRSISKKAGKYYRRMLWYDGAIHCQVSGFDTRSTASCACEEACAFVVVGIGVA